VLEAVGLTASSEDKPEPEPAAVPVPEGETSDTCAPATGCGESGPAIDPDGAP
jgi:hypothetical protein